MQRGGSDYIKLFNKAQFSDYRGNAHRNAKKKKVYESWQVIRHYLNIFNSLINSSLKNSWLLLNV